MSVRPSVGFPSTLTFEPPDLDFCTCMSHDHSSLGIEKCHRLIDQRQRLRLTEGYGYRPTVIELASTVTRGWFLLDPWSKAVFSVCSESCINKRHNIVSRITSLLTVYSILTSQPTANIILPKQLFCRPTSTITSSVQYDHRKYHVFAYSTSLLLLTVTLLTTTS